MTSYQNHFHDRLRILCRWFRSYTSLFQAFHISMIFAVIGCCDHPNHSLTQKLQVLRYSSFVLHHIANKTSPQSFHDTCSFVRLPSATLCQDQPAVSSPLHEEIWAGVPPKTKLLTKLATTYHYHQGGGPMHVGQSIRCSQGK